MLNKQDREQLLEGVRALNHLCLKVEKESVHVQALMVNGLPFTVTWMLGFDDELLDFEVSVSAIPLDSSTGGRIDKRCIDLARYLQERLGGLNDHEPWPVEIPSAWLEDAGKLIGPVSGIPSQPILP